MSKILFDRINRKHQPVPSDVLERLEDGMSRQALKMPAEFGVKTLVRDDSAKGLPTDLDREDEQAAPLPGAATPGGAGRDIGKFETNTPNNGIDERPRTLGVPGEDQGHPVNDNVSSFSRRTMTSAEIAVRTVMLRMSSWMKFKGSFPGVRSPLFHATTGPRAANIALRGQGLKSDSGFSNYGGQAGISMSRDLSSLFGGGFGKVIFVFDKDELERKFKVAPFQHPSVPDEFEERVEAEHIPASMIKGVILNWRPLQFELDEWRSLVDFPIAYQIDRAGTWGKRASEDEGFDKESYKQSWTRGKRQKRQRGKDRQKSRANYRRNKGKIKLKSKQWRKRNKNKGAFKSSEKRRRRTTRKRKGSFNEQPCPACLAETVLLRTSDYAPARERGGQNGKRQSEQTRDEQRQDAMYYRQNKGTRKRQNERTYHTKCKKNRRCVERREEWSKNPGYYERGSAKKRREASLLTVPEIAFGIGPEMDLGYIHSISPMTGMVTYEVIGEAHRVWESLPVEVFMRVAAFLSDEDLDSFFELVDAEIGEEAYGDLDESGLRACASLNGQDPDSEDFRGKCLDLTGASDLGNLSGGQFDQVNDSLVLGILEGENEVRNPDERDDGDETIGDEYDPHLYYGEVEQAKAEADE